MKRLFSGILAAATLFAGSAASAGIVPEAVYDEPPMTLVCGDVSRSGSVDITDAMLTLRTAQGIAQDSVQSDELALVCADVNSDRSVDTVDALMLLRSVTTESELTPGRRITFVNKLFEQMGKSYVYGGSGPDVFDCSGLVYYCLNQAGYTISRQSAAMYAANADWDYIESIDELTAGDLMFFMQAGESRITHVGVYIGNGLILHASSGAGRVVISTMSNWYTTNFRWGRRVDF